MREHEDRYRSLRWWLERIDYDLLPRIVDRSSIICQEQYCRIFCQTHWPCQLGTVPMGYAGGPGCALVRRSS